MTCRTAVGLIPDYLSATTSSSTAARFHGHINDCADCAAILRTYGKIIELTNAFCIGRIPQSGRIETCLAVVAEFISTHPLIGQ